MLLNFDLIFLLFMSHVNLILRPTRGNEKGRGKCLFLGLARPRLGWADMPHVVVSRACWITSPGTGKVFIGREAAELPFELSERSGALLDKVAAAEPLAALLRDLSHSKLIRIIVPALQGSG